MATANRKRRARASSLAPTAACDAMAPTPSKRLCNLGDSIPFVVFHDDGDRFSVNPDAVAFLESLGSKPLAVASIAGEYRQGKSFLVNRVLLQHPPGVGFDVGHTVHACTKGLHISTKLLHGSNPSDGDYNILVVDTEGLGATTATDTHDARIFSLALLLSSMFIYNSKGAINQNAINMLSLVTNISENIRTSSSSSSAAAENGGDDDDGDDDDDDVDDNGSRLAAFMPAFMWVVRDFSLQLVDADGRAINDREYLEQQIKPDPTAPPEKNKVRESLVRYFRHRDCVTLVRPCDDEKVLQTLSQQPDTVLKPEFLIKSKELQQKLLGHARPKRACGAMVTGPLLARLATIYCDAINKGAAPAIQDAWSLISADECQKAGAAALDAYQAHLSQHRADGSATAADGTQVPVPVAALERIIGTGFDVAFEMFKTRAVGEAAEGVRQKLREELAKRAAQRRTENLGLIAQRAHAACATVEDALMDQPTFEAVRKLHAKHERTYFTEVGQDTGTKAAWAEATALRVWSWAERYFQNVITERAALRATVEGIERANDAHRSQLAAAEKRADAAQMRVTELEQRLGDAETTASAAVQQAAAMRSECAAHADELDVAEARWRGQTEEVRAELAVAVEELNAARHDLSANQDAKHRLESRTAQLERSAAERDVELAALRAQATAFAEQEARTAQAEDLAAELEQRNSDLTEQLDRSAAENKTRIEQLFASSKQTIGEMRAAKDRATAAEAAATEAASKATSELGTVQKQLKAAVKAIDTVKADAEAAALHAKEQLAALRTEGSENAKRFQAQLDDASAQHREEMRKRAAKTREEHEALFEEKVMATSRAQSAESRLKHVETALAELRTEIQRERQQTQEHNYGAKVAELQAQLSTATTRADMQRATLVTKDDTIADLQAHITKLEDDLRQIDVRHQAKIMGLELDHARQLAR